MTASQIKSQFPSFNEVSDGVIQLAINEAEIFITSKYGKYKDICISYYVAHSLYVSTTNPDGEASQTLGGQAVGNVNVSYANPTFNSIDESYYNSSSYGQKFLEFRKKALRQFGASIV